MLDFADKSVHSKEYPHKPPFLLLFAVVVVAVVAVVAVVVVVVVVVGYLRNMSYAHSPKSFYLKHIETIIEMCTSSPLNDISVISTYTFYGTVHFFVPDGHVFRHAPLLVSQ